MRLEPRLRRIEQVFDLERDVEDDAGFQAEADRLISVMITRIPEPYREAIIARMQEPSSDGTQLRDWITRPFAAGAHAIPDEFTFPESILAFVLNPPRDYWFGHHCGTCGLRVPILHTWTKDPDPPPALIVFPHCPACGGKTVYWSRWVEGRG